MKSDMDVFILWGRFVVNRLFPEERPRAKFHQCGTIVAPNEYLLAPAPKTNVIFVFAILEYPQMQSYVNLVEDDRDDHRAGAGAKWRQRQE